LKKETGLKKGDCAYEVFQTADSSKNNKKRTRDVSVFKERVSRTKKEKIVEGGGGELGNDLLNKRNKVEEYSRGKKKIESE